MNLPWSRAAKRERLQAEPFPSEWRATLETGVRHYACLDENARARLRELTRIFVAEKNWEGCAGLILTDEMRVTIAAQACLLILERADPDVFAEAQSVLVYPGAYGVTRQEAGPGRTLTERREGRLGEAWSVGPVILSWPDALSGAARLGESNVALHEFAHKMDMRDGSADGVPTLTDAAEYDRWASVMRAAFDDHAAQIQNGEPTLLGAYAATNASEFFAVAVERFFQTPRAFSRDLPALYDVLQTFFRQNPAGWHCPDAGEAGRAGEHVFP